MLDTILNTAKDYIQSAVANNAEVPNHQNSSVSNTILSTLGSSLQSHLGGQSSGSGLNLSQLGNLLGGGNNSNFYNNTHSSVVDSLIQKTGLNPQVAHNVASAVLPGVVSAITSKLGANATGNAAGGILGNLLGKAGL
ncbi:hypothetical protein FACS189440_06620 [Bacteroidia bacterium]|nr:hypothetical protein FACS189423_04840 [Bacteroidia bacterium]GHT47084.1 hypothetical protein FACS189440_06620 [Bacteroidia bacterium]